ncbi:hypothetical protein CPT_Sonora_090 [Stenotrophomonas phage Sonora]|nr:hypothetical protein CPT_Sonora_090 [Stenotrophomonas phage Sonora]
MNRFRLGEPVPDDVTILYPDGRRADEYWAVRDRNLNTDEGRPALEQRILDAYKSDYGIVVWPRWFVTDDSELFVEMFRHLSMDFVADFRSGLFFLDLYGTHSALMASLFDLTGIKTFVDAAAEAYIEGGYGMFKSSQRPRVNIGEDVAVPDYFRPYKNFLERGL